MHFNALRHPVEDATANGDSEQLGEVRYFTRFRYVTGLLTSYGVFLALVVIVAVLAVADPTFISGVNLSNLLSQIAVNGLLAIGETFVILTGGIDLSNASAVGLAGVLMASFATTDGLSDPWLGIAIGLAGGLVFGLVNGLLVSRLKLDSFVVTLGTLAMGQGITFVYSGGQPIGDLPNIISQLGSGTVLGIPIPGIIFLVLFVIGWFVLKNTLFGRHVYATGGNEQAARLSGVNVATVKTYVYVISSVLAALGGIILAGRVDAGLPQSGQNYELNAIAAAVIGGVSLQGGRGSIWGTLVGVFLLGVISNGLDLLNVSPYYHSVVEGAIIILAVLIDFGSRKKYAK